MNSPLFNLNFPRAFPLLDIRAVFRLQPDDFFVEEQLGFSLSGKGEHWCLWIEKKNQNTIYVAKQLAEHLGIRYMDVGYCGLKDRHAVTRQWFSLYVGHRTFDVSTLNIEGCRVLQEARHDSKLRPGMHAGNTFIIRLRNVQGSIDALEQRWHTVCEQGVPNYFGEQRFGRHGGNLEQARALLAVHAKQWRERKHQFAVSALRSWLFNHVLADRVLADDWRASIVGEPESVPTGPLWGRGRNKSQDALAAREQQLLAPYTVFCEKLEHVGLQQERRNLLLSITNTSFIREGNDCVVTFKLPVGAYATSVLRECVVLENAQAFGAAIQPVDDQTPVI